ncbi:MAG: helical backbone metal receptor [Chitinophagales bacterium]|nr:helical backbone metal receptor [Chitinophagales bacterium]
MLNSKYLKDQLGREIQFPFPPKKIISIVPSQTELLFDLGLESEIIGITKFCIHPKEKVKGKIKVGGTKNLNIEKIKSLNPDLIIANKEENEEQQIKELMKFFPVYISDIKTLNDAYEMIQQVGEVVDRKSEAEIIIEEIKSSFSNPKLNNCHPEHFDKLSASIIEGGNPKSSAYLIWNNPMMTIGSDTFIHAMLQAAGFKNVFANRNRYPETSVEEIKKLKPEFLLLSSEPFPFNQKHVDELQPQLSATKIMLVDGEMFSWYGSRLLKAPEYFFQLQKKYFTNQR